VASGPGSLRRRMVIPMQTRKAQKATKPMNVISSRRRRAREDAEPPGEDCCDEAHVPDPAGQRAGPEDRDRVQRRDDRPVGDVCHVVDAPACA